MKRMKIIFAAFLVALVASNCDLNAQRGMREFVRDSLRMNRPDSGFMNRMRMQRFPMHDRNWMYGNRSMKDFSRSRGFSYYGNMDRRPGKFRPGPGALGYYRMPAAPYHRRPDSTLMNSMRSQYMGRYGYFPERIPGLTDSQKEKLRDLGEKNQSEMKQFRDETAATMRKMREERHKIMLEILDPEQKEWLESHIPDPRTR